MKVNPDGTSEIVPQADGNDESPKLKGMEITLAPAQLETPEAPPDAAAPAPGDANPNWSAMPRINRRAVGEGEGDR
jgi:hypothetical protein